MENENYLFRADDESIYISSNADFEQLCNPLTTGVIHNLEFRAAVMNVAMMILLTLPEKDRNKFITTLNEFAEDTEMVSNIIKEFRKGKGITFDLCPNDNKSQGEPEILSTFEIKPSKIKS